MKKAIAILLLGWASGFAANIAYSYDSAGRLVKADYGNGQTITYAYDNNGNLLSRTVAGSSVSPSVSAAGVVNAASFSGGAVAPGEMVTIFGTGIGPASLAGLQASNGVVASSVAGASFLFDGVAAPVIYVSALQSTVMVPYEVSGKAATQLQAVYQGVRSTGVAVPVAASAPGIFTTDQSGAGQGAILNQDGSSNSAANPAAQGSIIQLFLTGDGQTNPPGVDGQIAAANYPATAATVTATIGGSNAPVQYAGVAPLSVAGFSQVNLTVPMAAPSGAAVPVVVTIGQASTQTGVTVAIQ